ncbi:MAG: hypothetical protein AB7Y46_08085 [Armatimonadota bacterium]
MITAMAVVAGIVTGLLSGWAWWWRRTPAERLRDRLVVLELDPQAPTLPTVVAATRLAKDLYARLGLFAVVTRRGLRRVIAGGEAVYVNGNSPAQVAEDTETHRAAHRALLDWVQDIEDRLRDQERPELDEKADGVFDADGDTEDWEYANPYGDPDILYQRDSEDGVNRCLCWARLTDEQREVAARARYHDTPEFGNPAELKLGLEAQWGQRPMPCAVEAVHTAMRFLCGELSGEPCIDGVPVFWTPWAYEPDINVVNAEFHTACERAAVNASAAN